MASTMLTGDKRWAPTRKSSMTVLGKVPKPINLPSQRLENHGLDPNVEIVPKGTLTWGSRPSSTAPNAWASSALLSPNTDGSSGSPSHLNGRPSSGSGTRPSTAGSDRSHESASNARGPNSRPSSASGSLVSNQTSVVASRPRSAETRPSSAHLSRFAETPVESPVAWGPTRTAERVGPASSKTNDFTLTSGDFPTLGSDKNSDSRGHSSHGRPGSSSGTTATHNEAVKPLSTGYGNEDAYRERENVNSWKKESYPYVGSPPNMNWQRDPQQAHPYTSGNVPPQHCGPWHSAPIHPPDGVWYRGGAVGGPYRPAAPPGGYPMEPYACYPHFSTVGGPYRPGSEPVPNPGAGPRGYHPKNGDSYNHHQLPDSYIVPSHHVIPVRPGLYPSPVPYEGYYGPLPARFCDPSEHEISVREMSDQSGVHERTNQTANHDTEKFHVIPDAHASVMAKEHKEAVRAHETHPGQYKILLKQHDCSQAKSDAQDKKEQSVLGSLPQFDKGVLPGTTNGEEDRRRNSRKDERMVCANIRPGQEASSQRASNREGRSGDPVISDLLVNMVTDDSLMMKPEKAAFRPTKKNASLIEKLEGLNNKARSADGRSDGDEKTKTFKVAIKTDHSRKVISTDAASTQQPPSSGEVTSVFSTGNGNKVSFSDENYSSRPSEPLAFAVGKSGSSEIGEKIQPQGHKRGHVMRGRSDDHIKLRSGSGDANESIKKSPGSDILVLDNMISGGNVPGLQLLDSHAPQDAADESHHASDIAGVTYVNSTTDLMDQKAQRAKMKEIAMRRAKKLQEEEEERTREQKAKALAKLEELNRRTLAQNSNPKNDDSPSINDVLHKQEEDPTWEQKEKVLTKLEESIKKTPVKSSNRIVVTSDVAHVQDSEVVKAGKIDAVIIDVPGPVPAQSFNLSTQANNCGFENSVGSTNLSGTIASKVLISETQGPAIPNDISVSLSPKNGVPQVVAHSSSSDLYESNVSKRKHTSSRRRPNISKEENTSKKPTTAESITTQKNPSVVATQTLSSDSLPEGNSVLHKKRSNRNARNKSKMDEAVMSSTLQTPALPKVDLDKEPIGSGEAEPLTTLDPAQSIRDAVANQASITLSDQGQYQATETVHARVGSQWKPQSTKKSIKHQQVRPADKFHGSEAVIWAPVKPSNKNEPSGEVSQKSTPESNTITHGKNEHGEQNGMRMKRAEMERYVPKPVAKGVSQQNSQEPSPTLDQASSGTSKPDSGYNTSDVNASALGKPETDSKNGEVNKPNKRGGKLRTSWRQRNSAESPSLQNSTAGVFSGPDKPMGEPSDQNQTTRDSLPESQVLHDDDNNNCENLVPTEKITVPAVIKDQPIRNRQKRQQFVVHERKHPAPSDNKDTQSGVDDKICIHSPGLDMNESDRKNVLIGKGQSGGSEQMRSHWQPKSHANPHNHHHENMGDGAQKIASREVRFDNESQLQDSDNFPLQNEYNGAPAPRTNYAERQKANRGMPATVDQPFSSALQQHGHHNGRFGRGHGTTYRGRDLGGGDKRRGNSHFEYQPTGSYNKGDDSFRQSRRIGEEAQEGPRMRYREHDQPHSRRGGSHSYGQRSAAAVQAGDSFNITE